jgi:hypothetical protein
MIDVVTTNFNVYATFLAIQRYIDILLTLATFPRARSFSTLPKNFGQEVLSQRLRFLLTLLVWRSFSQQHQSQPYTRCNCFFQTGKAVEISLSDRNDIVVRHKDTAISIFEYWKNLTHGLTRAYGEWLTISQASLT